MTLSVSFGVNAITMFTISAWKFSGKIKSTLSLVTTTCNTMNSGIFLTVGRFLAVSEIILRIGIVPVSYTHLTLPTILLV